MDTTEPLAARLINARHKLGLTQAAAARRWGVSPRALAGWELGEHAPLPIIRAQLERTLRRIEKQTAGR
jgi:transcriptional regulator with XRE-family HTH domain